MAEPVEVIRAACLGGVPHGFLGRRGGVSTGVQAGLDMGLRGMEPDDPQLAPVMENRARGVMAILPGARLASVYQVHSPDVVVVDDGWDFAARPRGDAMVTRQTGVLLGILTADCAPVLFADREAGVVGAAHAGWRGAHGGVCEATMEAMVGLGAQRSRITAAIGPCIAQASYEVDEGFRGQFAADDACFFLPGRAGHWQFDLEGYVAGRVAAAGVTTVDCLGLDTYCDEARFFSYRRATHRQEPDYGRQMSLIGLP